MSLVTTPAVVLQTYRYSETSKVVRLATRDLGVHSAIAKGALRPKSRFGAGLEVLGEGVAQPYFREAPRPHTPGAFDLAKLRPGLAGDAVTGPGARLPAPVPRVVAAHRGVVAGFFRCHLAGAGSLPARDFWGRRAWVPPPASGIPIPPAAS